MTGVPYTFATATSPIPLSQLDSNFNTTLTIGSTSVGLGNSTASLANVSLTGSTSIAGANITAALTYGGVTLSNAVTGTGNMVLSASPTITGTITAASANFSGAITAANISATNPVATGSVSGSMRIDSAGAAGYELRFLTSANALSGATLDKLSLASGLTYGGVTLSNSVTGTGSMVLSASPTLTGTLTGAAANFSGSLLINQTTTSLFANVDVKSNGPGFGWTQTGAFGTAGLDVNLVSTNGYYGYWRYNGTAIGNINTNGTTVAYNVSSDYRLKENVQPMTGGLATVAALKPVTYDWIAAQTAGEGFIAHELQAVIPAAVTGEKDAVNEDGSIKPQGVDFGKIVPHLVAAIQELTTRLAALEAK